MHVGDSDPVIIRRTYTRARRYVQVVRWVMGYQLPVALQAAQFVAGGGMLVLMIQTRPWWGAHLHWAMQITIILTLPIAVAMATRYLRTDGTGPASVLIGLISLATAPTRGRRNGATLSVAGAHRVPTVFSVRVEFTDLPDRALLRWPGTPITADSRRRRPRDLPVQFDMGHTPSGATTRPSIPGPVRPARPNPARQAPARQAVRRTERASGTARALSVAEVTRAARALANGQFHAPRPDGPEPAFLGTPAETVAPSHQPDEAE